MHTVWYIVVVLQLLIPIPAPICLEFLPLLVFLLWCYAICDISRALGCSSSWAQHRHSGLRIWHCQSCSIVAAVAQIWSLAQELHMSQSGQKKKKKFSLPLFFSLLSCLYLIVTSTWKHVFSDSFFFFFFFFFAYLVDNLFLFVGHCVIPLSTSSVLGSSFQFLSVLSIFLWLL